MRVGNEISAIVNPNCVCVCVCGALKLLMRDKLRKEIGAEISSHRVFHLWINIVYASTRNDNAIDMRSCMVIAFARKKTWGMLIAALKETKAKTSMRKFLLSDWPLCHNVTLKLKPMTNGTLSHLLRAAGRPIEIETYCRRAHKRVNKCFSLTAVSYQTLNKK